MTAVKPSHITLASFSAPIIIFNFKKREWQRVQMKQSAAVFGLSIRDITPKFPGGRIELNATVGYKDSLFMINVPKWDILEMLRLNMLLRPIRRQSKKNLSIDAPDVLADLVPPEQYPCDIIEKLWKNHTATEMRRIHAAFQDPATRAEARLQLEALDKRRQVIEAVYPILPSGR